MLELNQIYNEDCLGERGMCLIPDKSVDMILTDIPYDEVNRESGGLRVLDKSNADIMTFDLNSFIDECMRISRGSIYIFCGINQVSHIRKRFMDAGLGTRHCIWEKTNPSPMNGQYTWLSSIENCVFARHPHATFNEHCKSAVWRYPNGSSKSHPTEKPLKLFKYLVETSTNEGDTVFDPCMGSGTTAKACMELNRNFIGFELTPEYHKIATERIANVQSALFV